MAGAVTPRLGFAAVPETSRSGKYVLVAPKPSEAVKAEVELAKSALDGADVFL